MMDIYSEKCIIMRYSHCANITKFTRLEAIACNTSRQYGTATAPRLQACVACYCTEQQEIKSNTREINAIKEQ